MNRRSFFRTTGGAGIAGMSAWVLSGPRVFGIESLGREERYDVVIAGGSLGGCAAALAACRAGCRVLLIEETDWIGGQLTSQAVPPDEHPWIESFGCTRSYRAFRNGVREYYRDHFPLNAAAKENALLNPGNGWVSRLCHEPRVALAVLDQMLARHIATDRLRIVLGQKITRVEVNGDRVEAVYVDDRVIAAPYFLDATELGDLLPMAGIEHVIGAEGRRDTGEPHATDEAEPLNQQAVTWCFAMDYVEGEDHTIEKPQNYNWWREYVPEMSPSWTGPLLNWDNTHPITLEPRTFLFDPTLRTAGSNIYMYRRISDPSLYAASGDKTGGSGISLVNWPQNDYWIAPLIGPGITADQTQKALAGSRELSRSLLYWMQTEAPRPDGGTGWKGLRLRGDVTGGPEGLAKGVYVREARRIRAELTVLEQHVSTEWRMEETGRSREEVTAATFPDSVGVGAYRIDLHPSTNGRNYVDLSSLPFQIPLGSLIPQRMENVLPACKNLGVTHITNGCYRLHPVEWNIGEAAGALVAFCLEVKESPRAVRNRPQMLARFQQRLRNQGFELEWPRLRAL